MSTVNTPVTPVVDVTIHNGGTLFQFVLNTEAAKAWVDEHVQLEDYQWLGSKAFAVEHRYAGDLADGMLADGLTIE